MQAMASWNVLQRKSRLSTATISKQGHSYKMTSFWPLSIHVAWSTSFSSRNLHIPHWYRLLCCSSRKKSSEQKCQKKTSTCGNSSGAYQQGCLYEQMFLHSFNQNEILVICKKWGFLLICRKFNARRQKNVLVNLSYFSQGRQPQ